MQIKENENLAKHTTFHLGGPARYFCEVENIEELKQALEFANNPSQIVSTKLKILRGKEKLPYFILGGGSNVIVDDEGYGGVVIKSQMSNLKFQKLGAPSAQIYIIEAEAGVSLSKIVSECEKNKLVGMEWAWGIPGTVGGAVRGNAGAYGGEMKDSIESVEVLRDGKMVELKNKDCDFGYRESIFKKNHDIILSLKLKLNVWATGSVARGGRASGSPLREKIKKDRIEKFSGGYSAGSFFKNVELKADEAERLKKNFPELPDSFVAKKIIPAAWLIDQCGLKGFCIGGICVSEKHAGIILNTGKGSSDELAQLVKTIKMKVKDRFGLNLEEEIQYLR